MVGEVFLDGKVSMRPDSNGTFDELFADGCDIHIEMMSDKQFWMAIRYPGKDDEVHVTVTSRGKLSVEAHEA